jgi:hypothetical protein
MLGNGPAETSTTAVRGGAGASAAAPGGAGRGAGSGTGRTGNSGASSLWISASRRSIASKRVSAFGGSDIGPGHPGGGVGQAAAPSSDTATSATSVGVRPTRTPWASSASALALAVPRDPETIAPAWPMVLPGGAVNPAM